VGRWAPEALLLLAAAGLLAAPGDAMALPVLSEVFYDAMGSDDGAGFIEIYGAPGEALDGLSLEGVNGSGGSVTVAIALSGVIPDDGLFVVADRTAAGATLVAEADLLANFDLQNGPDSVVLRSATAILDALGYGVFGAGEIFAGEGSSAPDAPAGSSLARRFADQDGDDNAADFVVLSSPTPGTAPTLGVPEPAPVLLWASFLWALGPRARGR